ncbi:MAG: hypothetical protein Tsb0021_15620 [Chlamydiales bacterium]
MKSGNDQKFEINQMNFLDLKKIRRGILRHIPLITLFGIIFGLLGGSFSSSYLDTYKAQAVLIYQRHNPQSTLQETFQMIHLTQPSAVEIVTLPGQLRSVISILGLTMSPEQLKSMIKVEVPVRESNLINISATADSPQQAVDIVNTVATVAVRNTKTMNKQQWQSAYAFYRNYESELSEELDKQSRAVADFRKQHRFIGLDATGMTVASSLKDLETQLQLADLDYKKMLVEYENLKREVGKIPDQIETPMQGDPLVESRVAQLETALLDARARYAPQNPKIKALEKQLNDLQAQTEMQDYRTVFYEKNPIKEKMQIDLISMQAKLRAAYKLKEELHRMVEESEQRATSLTEEHISFAEMIRKKEQLETDLLQVKETQRLLEALLNLGKSDLEVYQLAESAKEAGNPLIAVLIPLLGAFFGIFLGVTSAVILEVLDNKYRTANEIRNQLKQPCLLTVPFIPKFNPKRIDHRTLFYTRTLYERIQVLNRNFFSLAFTSSQEGEGKSVIAYQLAEYYRQLGKKVILVEFDYRPNPCFEKKVGNHSTLTDYLTHEASLEDVIQPGEPDRIEIKYNPVLKELLQGERIEHFWSMLREHYDLAIIDVPGVIEDEYAIDVLKRADTFVYVINSTKIVKKYVNEGFEELEAAHLSPLGVVLNNIKPVYFNSLQANTQKKREKRAYLHQLNEKKETRDS